MSTLNNGHVRVNDALSFENVTASRSERINKRPAIEAKAVVLDLDGTLLNSDGKIPAGAKEVLGGIEESGRPIILASARPQQSVLSIQQELNLSGAVIALNGAWIGTSQATLLTCPLAQTWVDALLERSLSGTLVVNLYTTEGWYVSDLQHTAILKECAAVGFRPSGAITDWRNESEPTDAVLKLLLQGEPEQLMSIMKEFRESELMMSLSSPDYLEIAGRFGGPREPRPVTKLNALHRVLSWLALTPADALAFGDGVNDASMLAAAGHGVSFQHASQAVQYFADEILSDPSGDGVVRYLVNCNFTRT